MTRLTRQGSSDIWRRLQRLVTRKPRAPHTHATHTHSCRPTAALLAILAATVALTLAAPASAQEARGTIAGTIRDTSGSVIPGATVTISNKEMGTTVTVVTNEVGFYQVPYLIPGTYQVDAELQGFKKAAREVEVRIADRLEIDLSLAVGETVESVTVTADTPLLETTNGSLGNVVDSRRIAQLPTPHGDPYALIGLAAGVTYTGSARLDRPFEPTHIVGYSMDGTRGNRSDLTIDGVPSTATANAGEVIASYVPPADIVQEFKVQTATFDASTGNTEGGVVNLMIKSGTNKLRGTAYIAKTPKGLFANDFFANANNIPLAPFDYNRYGGMAGGPMVLPGYDGRGKTFFLYGFEGIHESRPRNNGTPTVPTEKMRTGDFSELLALGPQYQIYNPFTRRSVAGGRFQQDPFPGNIIPQHMINPVARAAMEYFGRPTTAGNADGTSNFQNPSLPEDIKYANNTIRIDHNLTDKQRMYGRVSWYDRNSNYNNYFGNLSTGEWFKFVSRQVALDHVYVLTPSTVLNFRYGYNWFVRGTDSNPANHDFDLTSLGFPASYNASIPDGIRRFPRFDITGYQGTAVDGEERPNETQSFIATLNKSAGAHSLQTGMEFRQYRETDFFFANSQTGQFNFDSTWTRGPLDNSTAAPGSLGQSFASFLLGLPSSGSVDARGELRREITGLGLLRAGQLARQLAHDRQPRPALRVRDADDGGEQPERAWLRCHGRAGHRGGRAREVRAQSDAGSARERLQRPRRSDLRGRRRPAERALRDAQDQLHAARRPDVQAERPDRAPRRLRDVLRVPRTAPR